MSYTNSTENLGLPLYVGSDKPSYLGDWNEAMGHIDTGYGEVKTLQSNVAALETAVDGHTEEIASNSSAIAAIQREMYRLRGTELVIFGDSWSASTVAAATWPDVVGDITGLNVHNYAINGAGFNNSYMNQQVTTFKGDSSYDKDKIAAVLMVFGVNDQHVHGIDSSAEGTNIVNWMAQFVDLIPAGAPIIHVPNWAYGFTGNSIYKQGPYWAYDVARFVRANQPRYQFVECFSWFSCNDFNRENWYHLTAEASSGIFAHNMAALLGYGEVIHKPTFVMSLDSPTTRICMDIGADGMTHLNGIYTSVTEASTKSNQTAHSPFPFIVDLSSWAVCVMASGTVGSFAVELAKDGNNTTFDIAYPKSDTAGRIISFNQSLPWSEPWSQS